MTTYLGADLPIVIDSHFEFAADLVYSYGAVLSLKRATSCSSNRS